MNTTLKGYKFNFADNTLTMNYKFAAAVNVYGSPEYKLIQKIRKDFPSLRLVVKSGRERKGSHQYRRLTYENMEKHISVYENADELLAMFERAKALSGTAKSPYAYVRQWFEAQFPDYREIPACIERKPYAQIIEFPPSEEKNNAAGA